MDNLEEMHKFLEKYNLPKLNQEETEIHKHGKQNYNQKSSNKQKPRTRWLHCEFYQKFRDELTPIVLKLFQKTAEEGKLPNSFYEATIILIPKPDKDATKKTTGQYH